MAHHSTPRHAIARQIIAHHSTPWRSVASYSKIVVRELQPHPSACVGGGAAVFHWNKDKTNETTRKERASGAPANLWVGVPGGPRGRAVGCCGSRGRAPGCPRAAWALITWNMEAQSGMNMTGKNCYDLLCDNPRRHPAQLPTSWNVPRGHPRHGSSSAF